jgi:hypothetical protein
MVSALATLRSSASHQPGQLVQSRNAGIALITTMGSRVGHPAARRTAWGGLAVAPVTSLQRIHTLPDGPAIHVGEP